MQFFSILKPLFVKIKLRKKIQVTCNGLLPNFIYNLAFKKALETSQTCYLCQKQLFKNKKTLSKKSMTFMLGKTLSTLYIYY